MKKLKNPRIVPFEIKYSVDKNVNGCLGINNARIGSCKTLRWKETNANLEAQNARYGILVISKITNDTDVLITTE